MDNQENAQTDAKNRLRDWFENPLQSLATYALSCAVLALGGGFVGTRVGAEQSQEKPAQTIKVEDFATKQDKDELWRYINQRGQFRDKQQENNATKDEVRGISMQIEMLNKKVDQQMELQQQQYQLTQQLLMQRSH